MARKDMDAYRAYQREWRKKNRNRYAEDDRWRQIKLAYGITKADYDDMLEKQGGVCAICSSPPQTYTFSGVRNGVEYTQTRSYLCVDHCHETGRVRGLLCNNCNKGLGWHEKNHSQAQEYLKSYI